MAAPPTVSGSPQLGNSLRAPGWKARWRSAILLKSLDGATRHARNWCTTVCIRLTKPLLLTEVRADGGRELYANIEGPKTAQTILRHPKSPHLQPISRQPYPLIPDHLANSVGGPEKAGVGGSSPSLATTFSATYSCPLPSFCSILFQFQNSGLPEFASTQNGLKRFPPGLCSAMMRSTH